jgi:uncharacterized protein (DUF1015 family)
MTSTMSGRPLKIQKTKQTADVSGQTRTASGGKAPPSLRVPIEVPKILLPNKSVDLGAWAVIACDQYTTDPDYWKRAEALVGDKPSTLNLIFPEVYLASCGGGTPETDRARIDAICRTGERYVKEGVFRDEPPAFIALERDTPEVKARRGLVVAVDLEEYSFERGSTPLIRPTEKTIPERLPPRIAIRKGAVVELPHIILLVDDPGRSIIEPLYENPDFLKREYSVKLMDNAGQIRGSRVTPEGEAHVLNALQRFMAGKDVVLMVGDGNHSLATAKACWEAVKAGTAPGDPRRYALTEVQNLHDPSVTFEPIHRVLFNVRETDLPALLEDLQLAWPHDPAAEDREVTCVSHGGRETKLTTPGEGMSVVQVSEVVDKFLAEHADVRIDFVHGEKAVRDAVAKEGATALGLLLPPIAKTKFLSTLKQCGVMPRKSFSMGEAAEKRFYVEARAIKAV